MSPAEVMARAAFEFALETSTLTWEEFKLEHPHAARLRIEAQRAALRALAEMASQENIRDYLLAKAEEDVSAPGLSESPDELEERKLYSGRSDV